jgi:hypothetical protein
MKNLGFILIAVLIAGVLGAGAIFHFATKTEVAFTVDHRERVISRNSEGKTTARYMVWAETEQGIEVFENTDSLLALKFNSADLYGRMAQGAECVATVTGVRVPVLSMNRNILHVECERAPG